MMKKMEEINTDESSNRRYITRINTEVIPIFRYSASVVNWKVTDLDRMDLEIRKYLRKAKYISCNSKDRLYVNINEMGEWLISLIDEYVIELIRTVMYYCTRESEIGNNILDRWYSKKGIWNRIKKALGHKIPETKIEEIINEMKIKKKKK